VTLAQLCSPTPTTDMIIVAGYELVNVKDRDRYVDFERAQAKKSECHLTVRTARPVVLRLVKCPTAV